LRARGVEVIGERTTEPDAHERFLDAVAEREPDLLLDNGGDLFARVARRGWPRLRGGTEETTSGRARLAPLREAIRVPVLVINDSPIKQFAENRLAVGQSLFESYLRFTNRSANGKRVLVFGYGACGRGAAAAFRAGHAVTSVVELDPVKALEAHLDGFLTPRREEALRAADVIVTVTGAANVVSAADLPGLKDGAILLNGGHLPHEIAVEAIRADPSVAAVEAYPEEGIETLRLADGRRLHVLGGGHMANLAGPRPLGNSVEAMDLGFALQARCLERVARGGLGAESCVAPVPREIDAAVARAYLELHG
jgi:adenosylhomocysteinase